MGEGTFFGRPKTPYNDKSFSSGHALIISLYHYPEVRASIRSGRVKVVCFPPRNTV